MEIEENSELDLLVAYKAHRDDPRIPGICEEMAREMGEGRYYPEMNQRMAQLEVTLLDWAEQHRGAREYVAFADKCWPAFPEAFGFEPLLCELPPGEPGHPRLLRGIRISIPCPSTSACASPGTPSPCWTSTTPSPPTCTGRTSRAGSPISSPTPSWASTAATPPSCKLCADRAVKYQLIQHRLLEPKGSQPDFTRGTLEGDIAASPITFYRLQCDSEGRLRSYIAQGEVLPVRTRSFGGIGVFAIPEMGRFYRTCWWRSATPTTGRWPSATTARPCSR